MGHSKLVKAAVDHFYCLLWIFPGLWIKQSSKTQQLLHGSAWAKNPYMLHLSGTCKGNACLITVPCAST